jgi:type I restriction enzyme S subunit
LSDNLTFQASYLSLLRQSVLQEAIEGKLTVDWRKKHSELISGKNHASKLLEKIKAEKERLIKEGKIKKEKPLPLITDTEKPFALSEGWGWCRLGEAGLFGRGKSKHRPRNDASLFINGTIPFIQTGEVSQSKYNRFLIEKSERFYNEKGLAQSNIWPTGTLCITIAANIAETGFLTIDACFPDSVVGFTSLSGNFTPWFVRHYLSSIQEQIIKFAPATAQKNINLEIIGALLFPMPPLAEQQAIVERVDKLMTMIDALEKQVTERKDKSERLMQSVLREAFESKA